MNFSKGSSSKVAGMHTQTATDHDSVAETGGGGIDFLCQIVYASTCRYRESMDAGRLPGTNPVPVAERGFPTPCSVRWW